MNEEKTSNKKILVALCIILGLLVVILGGYVIYDQVINKHSDSSKEELDEPSVENQENEYQNYTLDGTKTVEEKYTKLLFYIPNDTTNFNDLTDKAKMEFIWTRLKYDPDRTETDSNGNTVRIFTREHVEELLKSYFGDQITFHYANWTGSGEGINPVNDELYALKYNSEKNEFSMGVAGALGDPTDPEVVWKWVSARADEEEVVYTAQVIFRNRDLSISKDALGTDRIDQMELDESQGRVYHPSGKTLEDFLDQSYTYEYTFTKDSDPVLKEVKIIK